MSARRLSFGVKCEKSSIWKNVGVDGGKGSVSGGEAAEVGVGRIFCCPTVYSGICFAYG